MSGIEVAGLVLGAFPVAIWALEQYRDAARVMGFWYEIRLEYQRSSSELKFHQLTFIRNLKRLLLPLVPDDAQLQLLISEPGGFAWKDPGIRKALEARLNDSYEMYLEILGEMQRIMRELNQELAVDSEPVQHKVNNDETSRAATPAASRLRRSFNRSTRNYQVFRVKFSVGERTRTRLFTEFQTYNDRLEKLMSTSDVVAELEDTRQNQLSTRSKFSTAAMTKFWNSADKLYRALFGAWSCSCRDHHCAQLILRHREPSDKDFHLYLEAGIQGIDKWSTCSVTMKTFEHEHSSKKSAVADPMGNKEVDNAFASMATPLHQARMPQKSSQSAMGKMKKSVHITVPQSFSGMQTAYESHRHS